MKKFLSEQRLAKLKSDIRGMNNDNKIPEHAFDRMLSTPDDLQEVDLTLTAHVMAVGMFRRNGKMDVSLLGMTIIKAFMEEAMERGLGENDFPISLQAIKDDLSGRGVITLQ